MVNNLTDHTKLPKEPKKLLAIPLREDKNELAIWRLAGDGWKAELQAKVKALTDDKYTGLNTPKSEQVQDLFKKTLGLNDVTASWKWQKMNAVTARTKLDGFITLRGSIAHRGAAATGVKKKDVTDFLAHVELLVEK